MKALRRQEGAAAVEFAIVAALLFMLIFGIIAFGIAFMQLQTVRGAVREGARVAAVGATPAQAQQRVVAAAGGVIAAGSNIAVVPCPGQDRSVDARVSFDTQQLNGGQGIEVSIPLLPKFYINPVVSAQFRCEV